MYNIWIRDLSLAFQCICKLTHVGTTPLLPSSQVCKLCLGHAISLKLSLRGHEHFLPGPALVPLTPFSGVARAEYSLQREMIPQYSGRGTSSLQLSFLKISILLMNFSNMRWRGSTSVWRWMWRAPLLILMSHRSHWLPSLSSIPFIPLASSLAMTEHRASIPGQCSQCTPSHSETQSLERPRPSSPLRTRETPTDTLCQNLVFPSTPPRTLMYLGVSTKYQVWQDE